jgi:hypothetical protein
MDKMKESYKKISVGKFGDLLRDPKSIRTYVPEPSQLDYDRSYITRYFVRKFNDENGIIFEVDNRRALEFNSNSFYVFTDINWKISKARVEDVKEMNRKSIMEGQQKISNLHLYLPNLTQFYKDIEY